MPLFRSRADANCDSPSSGGSGRSISRGCSKMPVRRAYIGADRTECRTKITRPRERLRSLLLPNQPMTLLRQTKGKGPKAGKALFCGEAPIRCKRSRVQKIAPEQHRLRRYVLRHRLLLCRQAGWRVRPGHRISLEIGSFRAPHLVVEYGAWPDWNWLSCCWETR